MKRIIFALALGASLLMGAGCQQLTDLETKVDQNTSDIATLKTQVAALQDIVNKGYVITETKEITGGYEFTLSNGKKITVTNGKDGKDGVDGKDGKDGKDGADGKDGKDGDSFFGSVTVDQEAGIVKIVLKDGTAFNIPLAVEKSIVEQITKVMYFPEYSDLKLTFNYFDDKDYEKIKLNFAVLPAQAMEKLAANMDKAVIMVGAFGLKTRATSSVGLESTVTYDSKEMVFTALVDPKNYLAEYGLDTEFGLSVAIADADFKCQIFSDIIPVHSNCTALDYAGVKYHTATLADGSTWMADPLRYIPDGATVSDDPSDESAIIFFPYTYSSIQRDTTVKGGKTTIKVTGVPEAKKDQESIAKLGLLYTSEAIFGQEITAGNYMTFEGKKGICPEGWHIPSRNEWFSLIGNSLKCYGESAAPADDPSAVFYDKKYKGAKVASFNEAGFNFVLGGTVSVTTSRAYGTLPISDQNSTVEAWYDMPSMTYLASSTAAPTSLMFMAAATTFTSAAYPEGRVSIMQAKSQTGMQVRCVKD